MTTAIITKLRSGGALFELGPMQHFFPSWREAVADAEACSMEYVVLDPPARHPVVAVLASTS